MTVDIKDKVAIVGAGCTKFAENFEMSYGDLVAQAAFEAFEESGVDPRDIDAAWLSCAFPDNTVYHGKAGHDLSEPISLYNIPVTRVSNFCGSAGDAIQNAIFGLLSKRYNVVMALGVEKMRDRSPRNTLVKMMVETLHPFYQKGFTPPGTFAVYANHYIEKYGLKREHLAKISVKNHRFGVHNPKAQYRQEISVDTVLNSPMVAYPLTVMDCCPTTDGAAAVILMRTEDARAIKKDLILFKGVGFTVVSGWDLPYFDPRHDYLTFKSAEVASRIAYDQAGIKDPLKEIDVAEAHDCFTINEAITYNALGLCPKLEDIGKHIDDGIYDTGGLLPINTSGGLLSCGHPVGATGLRMVYALKMQLEEKAGAVQVKNARIGLAENMGGPASICSINIVGRD